MSDPTHAQLAAAGGQIAEDVSDIVRRLRTEDDWGGLLVLAEDAATVMERLLHTVKMADALLEKIDADRDRLRAALREWLAASDEACDPNNDDIASMLRYGEAIKQARAALDGK